MSNRAKRLWVSPFVAVTYVTVACTGLLLLFHLKFPGVYSLHQWGGLLFIISGALHLSLNWRVFVSYLKNNQAIGAILVGVLALVLIALTVPSGKHGNQYRGGAKNGFSYESGHRR